MSRFDPPFLSPLLLDHRGNMRHGRQTKMFQIRLMEVSAMRNCSLIFLLPALFVVAGCGQEKGVEPVNRWIAEPYHDTDCDWVRSADLTSGPEIADLARAYAQVDIAPDLDGLTAGQRSVLDELVAAGRILHELFRVQATPCFDAIHARMDAVEGPHAEALKRYFDINAGPWDRRQGMVPYIGDRTHPAGANYYPLDLTRADRDEIADPELGLNDQFSMVRRDRDGELTAVPYSVFFGPGLEQAGAHLRKAAELTENESLRAFLVARAESFLSDDYFESDMLWMDLDSEIEVTIGPYEVYEDRLFGYKAAFTTFVTIADPVESQRLARFEGEQEWLEANLPLPDRHRNPHRGSESPIRAVDLVYSAGDTRAGVQTIAFVLPNDERVREAKGSKKVLLRNIMNAKFTKILQPIADVLVVEDQLPNVKAESFFLHTLWHEMSHGLGPGKLVIDGRQTEVRLELKEAYSVIEETKADVMGMWAILKLQQAGRDFFPEGITRHQPATYLAGMFRSVRFGIASAHARANAIQFNYLLDKGAIAQDEQSGRFMVHYERFFSAVELLLNELLMIQAEGDYEAARRMIERYAHQPSMMIEALAKLEAVPVDIQPVFKHYPGM
jgi:hypothetical protein